MSDFGSSFNPQIGKPASSAPHAIPAWRRIASSARNSLVRSADWKKWVLLTLPMLVVIPVAAAIVWFASKPNPLVKESAAGKSSGISALLLSHGNIPKPAPGKTRQEVALPLPSSYTPLPPPTAQPPQPTGQAPDPAQSIASSVGPAPIVGAVPTVPTIPVRPMYSPMTYHARHDKVFGEGCSGQLILNSGGLVFDCPDDPHSSVQIALSEIGAVDENGVRLLSGKKFHFSIRGMTKEGESQLFVSWLHQVR